MSPIRPGTAARLGLHAPTPTGAPAGFPVPNGTGWEPDPYMGAYYGSRPIDGLVVHHEPGDSMIGVL